MYSLVLWLKLQALQIKFQPSFNHSRLLFQVLYLLMFSLKVKLAGVHASFPFYWCFGTLIFWLMYNHKRLSCHSDIVSRFDLQFMLKDRHLMPGAVSCLCVCDITDWSSYFYWTQSFFGHSGFAPAGTGNSLTERVEEAIKGEKQGKKTKLEGTKKKKNIDFSSS